MPRASISNYLELLFSPFKISAGESFKQILTYFYPELITTLILYFGISFIDLLFVSKIKTTYVATLGVTNSLIHFLTKIAEGLSIGAVILCGQYNGAKEYQKAGKSLTDAFWATCIFGALISILTYFGTFWIFFFLGIPDYMIQVGVPFLRLRIIGIFFNFVFFGLIGFLRGIKNTRVSMYLFLIGACVFLLSEYLFIFGNFGVPALYFQGSALASVLQYGAMSLGALFYIFSDKDLRCYGIKLFSSISFSNILKLLYVSWPVMVDKSIFALCFLWLSKLISILTIDSNATSMLYSSFSALNNYVLRFVILPGLAFAQVITFLVSNDYKLKNWHSIECNIKKILLLSVTLVFILLFIFSLGCRFFIQILDKDGVYTDFTVKLIPFLSVLIFLDLIQLILSAALRGTASVKTVMWVRLLVTIFYFFPVSYLITLLPIESLFIKFILVYSSFYIANGIMSFYYIKHFKNGNWKNNSL